MNEESVIEIDLASKVDIEAYWRPGTVKLNGQTIQLAEVVIGNHVIKFQQPEGEEVQGE